MTLSRRVAPFASGLLAMATASGAMTQAPIRGKIPGFDRNGKDAGRGTGERATGCPGTGDGKKRGEVPDVKEEPPVKPAAPR